MVIKKTTDIQWISQQAIHNIQQAIPDIIAIYLFGSFYQHSFRTDSDIDLAVLAAKPLSRLVLWELAEKIAADIHRDVDLVDLRQVSTVFAYEILMHSKRIFCGNHNTAAMFETSLCSMYLSLQEEHREILIDLQQQGTIYG